MGREKKRSNRKIGILVSVFASFPQKSWHALAILTLMGHDDGTTKLKPKAESIGAEATAESQARIIVVAHNLDMKPSLEL